MEDSLGRSVVMVGMVHVNKDEGFFDSVREYLDSLKSEGYVVFYEGLARGTTDSLRLDTVHRKIRRVLGWYPQYPDRSNKSLPRWVHNKRLIVQSHENLGLTTDQDFNVDLTRVELVDHYEEGKGEILLSDYDWHTGLLEKFKPKKTSDTTAYSEWYMLHTIREAHIAEQVVESKYKKIVLVYGRAHIPPLRLLLEEQGFEQTLNMYEYKPMRKRRWRDGNHTIDPQANPRL